MRNLLLFCALLTTLAVRAGDHRVCTYRGAIIGTDQKSTDTRPARVSLRGYLVVDWADTATDLGGGWSTLSKVTLVAVTPEGTVTRADYSASIDAAKPPFALVPQPDDSRGLLVVDRVEESWEALMLTGANYKLTVGDATWQIPLRLLGRYLAYTTTDGPDAVNSRYVFSLDRVRTLLTAQVTDGATAFDTAVANAEAALKR